MKAVNVDDILKILHKYGKYIFVTDEKKYSDMVDEISNLKALEQEPRKGHCKDCKWWKDSDGEYRRGVVAESQCPINRKEVYEGNGYCYMFEPQESEG